MNPELLKLYRRCRRDKPFMLVGYDAQCSLSAAKTILAFRELEDRGLVRLRAEPELENYFDVYGDDEIRHAERNGHPVPYKEAREELIEILDRDGVWWTCSEWFDGDEWQIADSCGMHTGYRDVLSPFENCYIVDHMRAAVDAWQKHQEEMAAAV